MLLEYQASTIYIIYIQYINIYDTNLLLYINVTIIIGLTNKMKKLSRSMREECTHNEQGS